MDSILICLLTPKAGAAQQLPPSKGIDHEPFRTEFQNGGLLMKTFSRWKTKDR